MATKHELQIELKRLHDTGFADMLGRHANAHGFPIAYFYAIASRETNCVNELGDVQGGEAHGIGIVQIDVQHDLARQARDSGSWRTHPEPLIEFGAQLVARNIAAAKHNFPDFSEQQWLKIAASGYNAGMGPAIAGAKAGDSDKNTTGHDYGRDVMARMAIFEQLLAT
jgi:hypothetical protein